MIKLHESLITRAGTPKTQLRRQLLGCSLASNPLLLTTKDKKNCEILAELCIKNPGHYSSILRAKRYQSEYGYLLDWIYQKTPKLKDTPTFQYTLGTRLYWIFNGLQDFPKCQRDGCNELVSFEVNVGSVTGGYHKFCSTRYSSLAEQTQQLAKKTTKKRHGSETYRNIEQSQKTCLKKYRKTSFTKTRKFKQKLLATQQQRKEKEIKTKRERGTLNTSAVESRCYEFLLSLFSSTDIKTQYKTIKYPFFCDFYIVSKDTYIECNFHWTHGGQPYNSHDQHCHSQLRKWKKHAKTSQFYANALNTWTVRDPKKRLTAKQNHLNYIECWSEEEFQNLVYMLLTYDKIQPKSSYQ